MVIDSELNVPQGRYAYESKSGPVCAKKNALLNNNYMEVPGPLEAVYHHTLKTKVMSPLIPADRAKPSCLVIDLQRRPVNSQGIEEVRSPLTCNSVMRRGRRTVIFHLTIYLSWHLPGEGGAGITNRETLYCFVSS